MKNFGLVYSTDRGRMCPDCGQPKERCNCMQNQSAANGDGVVRVSRETKGRKGKGVTLITGIPLTEIELKFLAKELKVKCGSGGTVKNGIIEIQGDHRDKLLEELQIRGWTAKRVGGKFIPIKVP
ncbi:MAG: translation initiation factor Sui1 [Candidatus Marinimicrobia bacterium]|nr:translation initiation factor Sui1 [Candidatus Neomarinimicrobiota bacterium]